MKIGKLITTKNIDIFKNSGVTWSRSIDKPEIPLSYSLTGYKNKVTPNALMIPAIKRKRKLIGLISLKWDRYLLVTYLIFLIFYIPFLYISILEKCKIVKNKKEEEQVKEIYHMFI